ncbi:hypothetical protein GALL_543410 [mine drainage metagenome]|uniref:Uncharacterized protein n=1 Tax=mine drainage metagenome TaxID=410659 RepID=A0A1J5P0N3_9ZZZZ
MDMHVDRQGPQHDAREAADAEEEDERQREEERRLEINGALVEGAHPVEHLDGAGDGHDHREQREDHDRDLAEAAGEHVVGPDQAAHTGDRHAGEGDGLVAEDGAPGEGGQDLRDRPHGRQDHDVDGRMGVDPEQVLVKEWIAALGGIADPDAEHPFEDHEDEGDGEDGRGQDLDPGGGVDRPAEERHPEPVHAGGPEPVDGGDEVDACEHRGEAQQEGAEDGQRHVGAGVQAEGHVEGPARVGGAMPGEEGDDDHGGAGHVEIPGGQVQPREGHILRPDEDGQEEIPEDRRQSWHHEQEDHDHAMDREQGVVGLGGDQMFEG